MHEMTCRHFQAHDETTQGRLFTCSKCGARECVRCNVREHEGETCGVFQARLHANHGHEEAQTATAFEEGYMAPEATHSGAMKEKFKEPKPCPACGVMIEREDKCPHMTCKYTLACDVMVVGGLLMGWVLGIKCGNQFCIRCNAPYYGENSVPELGNKAHQPECVYYKREKEDRRFQRKVKVVKDNVATAKEEKVKVET